MSAKKGLGKGLDSLIPVGASVDVVTTAKNEKVHNLAVDIVKPRANQPRQSFDDKLLNQLAKSIEEQGILQPIVVTEVEQNVYSIVAGERRWRAAQLAGLEHVPAIIKQVDELEHLQLALLENVQRADLNALETAIAIDRLHKEHQQSYEDIAVQLGKAYTTVVNLVRLLQLPEEAKQALVDGTISEGHGRALLSLAKYGDVQQKLFKEIISKKLSVRQAEAFAVEYKNSLKINATKPKVQEVKTEDVSKVLSAKFGVNVKVSRSKTKGKITITYKTKKEYENLLNKLR